MTIAELLKKINERFPSSTEKERMVENLYTKRSELHISDLDLALIFIGITIYFKNISALSLFAERKELLLAIVDSSFAKFFDKSIR